MSFLSFLYRNGVWVAPPLFAFSAVLLGFLILNLVRWVERSEILNIPLVERQEVDLAEAGRVALCVEGPLPTRGFANLTYELSAGDGTRVAGRTKWVVEMAGRLNLAEAGWTTDSIKAGDRVTVTGNPTHTGFQRMFFRRLVRADGTELLRAGPQRLNAIEEERRQRALQRNQPK